VSSTSPNTSHPSLKAHIERTFARLTASLLVGRDQTDSCGRDQTESCACLTNEELWTAFHAEVYIVTVGKFADPNAIFKSTLVCRKIKKADWLVDD
jgi:hypothetical protein